MKVSELFEAEEKKAAIDKLELAVQDLKLPKELPVAQGETVDLRRRSFMKRVTQLVASQVLPVNVTGELAALAVPQVTAVLQAVVAAPAVTAAVTVTDAKLAQAIVTQVAKVAVQHAVKPDDDEEEDVYTIKASELQNFFEAHAKRDEDFWDLSEDLISYNRPNLTFSNFKVADDEKSVTFEVEYSGTDNYEYGRNARITWNGQTRRIKDDDPTEIKYKFKLPITIRPDKTLGDPFRVDPDDDDDTISDYLSKHLEQLEETVTRTMADE